jgi:hypothetical protein
MFHSGQVIGGHQPFAPTKIVIITFEAPNIFHIIGGIFLCDETPLEVSWYL